jgi:hypothetical protein
MTVGTTEEVRDRLTRQHLSSCGEAPQAGNVRRFRREWWDGAAHAPSLVVDLEGTRCRLVQVGGQVVALPANRWRARRAIRRLRRRATVDAGLIALAQRGPDPRLDDRPRVTVVRQRKGDEPPGRPTMRRPRRDAPRLVVHIDQDADVVRCGTTTCSALVPIPPPGRLLGETSCPQCGRVQLPTQQLSPSGASLVLTL